jgi:AraC family transcriptional regulator
VIECIHANIDRSIGVNELADAAQQSWSHFPRLFRRSTGLSPYQYVVKVRLQRAIGLLRTTKLSMTAVAAHAGFADHAHFCRWLRRMYGVSPTQLVARLR